MFTIKAAIGKWNAFRGRAANFKRGERGSISITAALSGMVLCAAMGCGIDIGREYTLATKAQGDLDSAVLAAVQSKSAVEKSLATWLQQEGGGQYRIEDIKTSADDKSVVLKAAISAEIPASFMTLFGVKMLGVRVSSSATAPLQVQEMQVKIDNAYGYSNKIVRAMVERPDGTIVTLVKANYVFTDPNGAGGRGTGITTVKPTGVVSTGQFKRLWFEMAVKEYDTGRWVTYSSDDPATSNHLYIDGTMLPLGATVSLSQLIPCGGQPSIHQWEDSSNPADWGIQDITLTVQGKCGDVAHNAVRLLD